MHQVVLGHEAEQASLGIDDRNAVDVVLDQDAGDLRHGRLRRDPDRVLGNEFADFHAEFLSKTEVAPRDKWTTEPLIAELPLQDEQHVVDFGAGLRAFGDDTGSGNQFQQAIDANGFFLEQRHDRIAPRLTGCDGVDFVQFVGRTLT